MHEPRVEIDDQGTFVSIHASMSDRQHVVLAVWGGVIGIVLATGASMALAGVMDVPFFV